MIEHSDRITADSQAAEAAVKSDVGDQVARNLPLPVVSTVPQVKDADRAQHTVDRRSENVLRAEQALAAARSPAEKQARQRELDAEVAKLTSDVEHRDRESGEAKLAIASDAADVAPLGGARAVTAPARAVARGAGPAAAEGAARQTAEQAGLGTARHSGGGATGAATRATDSAPGPSTAGKTAAADAAPGAAVAARTKDLQPPVPAITPRVPAPRNPATGPAPTRGPPVVAAPTADAKPARAGASPRWVDENARMSPQAFDYQSSAIGARSNVASRSPQAPELDYRRADGTPGKIRFDGYDDATGVLVDRKVCRC